MASGGVYYSPYYQPAAVPYYYNYPPQQQQRVRGGGGQSSSSSSSSSSVYAFILLATLSFIAATTLHAWCESAMESLLDQLRRLLILSPLLAIVAVQLWVATGGGGGVFMCLVAEMVTGDSRGQYGYGGAGGAGSSSSPWGVALALVLVLFLVSYQSSFQLESWSHVFGVCSAASISFVLARWIGII